ncbi:dihydrofolate reductase [Nesterenkonia sp. MY13]|uniref:Dihydrofolate reductase n=1 Tax=Nesterenkonia sedimenti TaxID=1463632 RepID=A0A7X8YCN6_9MICC|nr:dihydrofolate reductase family protein [Nesterenkonia sedimenti]NLS08501.1 dihydrofolate reductase [Nesterenkonia sedimenti]
MTAFIYSVTASADGYIAGPDGDMSWLLPYLEDGPDPIISALIPRITAVLMGRRSFDGDDPHAGDAEQEGTFEGQWHGPQVLLTNRAVEDPPAGFLISNTFDDAIATAREAAGPDGTVNVIGADIARQCLEAGILDEVTIATAPLFLGQGTRLLSGSATKYSLHPVNHSPPGEQSNLHTTHYRITH